MVDLAGEKPGHTRRQFNSISQGEQKTLADWNKKTIEENFPEIFSEMKGIAKGAKIDIDELVLWNNLASLDYALPKLKVYLDEMPHLKNKYGHLLETLPAVGQLEGGSKDKCSAFMALGDYTSDGKICCAHNSFDNFIDGQNFNIVIDLKPTKGHRILFQSAPGYISSQTDFFINSKGFIGTEQVHPMLSTCRG